MRLVVLGASGGCGGWAVKLAAKRGHQVRAVVRRGSDCALPDGAERVEADVLDDADLARAISGCDAVLSCLGLRRRHPWNPWSRLISPPDLTERVARGLVATLPASGVQRLVAISAAGVAESRPLVSAPLRWLIARSQLRVAYEDLARMECVLGGSSLASLASLASLDWVAVRPVTLVDGPPTGRAAPVERYGLLDRVRRADVAAWMIAAVESPERGTAHTPLLGTRRA